MFCIVYERQPILWGARVLAAAEGEASSHGYESSSSSATTSRGSHSPVETARRKQTALNAEKEDRSRCPDNAKKGTGSAGMENGETSADVVQPLLSPC